MNRVLTIDQARQAIPPDAFLSIVQEFPNGMDLEDVFPREDVEELLTTYPIEVDIDDELAALGYRLSVLDGTATRVYVYTNGVELDL